MRVFLPNILLQPASIKVGISKITSEQIAIIKKAKDDIFNLCKPYEAEAKTLKKIDDYVNNFNQKYDVKIRINCQLGDNPAKRFILISYTY